MGCIRILLSPFGFLFGAVAMMTVGVAGFAIAVAAMGAPACYRDDSWVANDAFAAILLGIGFVGAIVGGAVARKTSGVPAVLLLVAFAAVIHLVPHLDSPLDASKSQRFAGRPESRPDEAPFSELVQWTEHPGWMRYAGALAAVTGVVFGSSLAQGGRKPARASRGEE